MKTLGLDAYKRAIALAWKCLQSGNGYPVTVLGRPGAGKSALPEAFAREQGAGFRSRSFVQCDPTDVMGLPDVSGPRTVYKAPAWIPLVGDDSPERGILLLDDVTDAPKAVQASLYELIHARRVAGQDVKPGWLIISTGNRPDDLAASEPLSFAFANRGAIFTYAPSPEDTSALATMLDWADPLPGYLAWSAATNHAHEASMESVAAGDYAQPTNRAFENLSRAIKCGARHEEYAHFVGEATSSRLYDYVKLLKTLPTIEAILANPRKADIPDSLGAQYAVAAGLAKHVISDPIGAQRLDPYVARLAKALQTYYRQAVIRSRPSIVHEAGWTEWATGIYSGGMGPFKVGE